MILAILFLASVTFTPAAPTVGDLVTLDFPAPVVLDPSQEYEVVSQQGRRVVVRTFAPKPFTVSGTGSNGVRASVKVPVRSVLKLEDLMTPAPLATPRAVPYARGPFIAIALAALAAIAAWAFVWWRSRRKAEKPAEPQLAPDERYRRAVLALRAAPSWAKLADETRLYLAATRRELRKELTTSELVPRLQAGERVVIDILRNGDLEKFSKRKPDAQNFEEVALRALELAKPEEPPMELAS